MQQFLHYDVGKLNGRPVRSHDYSPVKNHLAAGKPVFLLVYMDGCGPCEATIPEWDKVHQEEEHRAAVPDDAMMVRVNRELKEELAKELQRHALGEVSSFPTIGALSPETPGLTPFEGAERSAPHFVHWVTETTQKHRGKKTRSRPPRRLSRTRTKRQTRNKGRPQRPTRRPQRPTRRRRRSITK